MHHRLHHTREGEKRKDKKGERTKAGKGMRGQIHVAHIFARSSSFKIKRLISLLTYLSICVYVSIYICPSIYHPSLSLALSREISFSLLSSLAFSDRLVHPLD
jgi:hypothetical protein